MANEERIVFSEGVTRADGAGLSAPHDLQDARVRLSTGVEGMPAINDDNALTDTFGNPAQLPLGERVFPWKDGYVRARDAAQRGDLLYALRSEGITVYGDDASEYTSGKTGIPHIREVTIGTSVTEDPAPISGYTGDDGPHRDNGFITYLLIPVNSRDEAGPWIEVTWHFGGGNTLGDFEDGPRGLPELGVQCSSDVTSILLFSTAEFGETNPGEGFYTPPGSRNFWFLDRFDIIGSDEYDAVYAVTKSFSLYLDTNGDEQAAPPDGAIIDRSRVLYTQKQLAEDPDAEEGSSANLLRSASLTPDLVNVNWRLRYRFMWDPPETIKARTIHLDAGVAYYGGTTFNFERPNYSFWLGGPLSQNINFRREYVDSEGNSKQSASLYLEGVLGVLIPYQGENALLAYNEDETKRSRYQVDVDGVYESSQGATTANIEFGNPLFAGGVMTDVEEEIPEVTTILEPDKLFLSNQNRPLEVTYDQVIIPGGNEVRSLFPARLAEEESLRGYAFYAATEDDIFVLSPDNTQRAVSVDSVAGGQFGQALSPRDYPAFAPMATAVAVLGTDNRVYVLSGRQGANQPLFHDEARPWNVAYDIAYDIGEDELLISTDRGIWRYDPQRQGLFAQHNLDFDLASHGIWEAGSAVFLFRETSENTTGTWYALQGRPDNSSTMRTPRVVTQPLTPFGQDLNVAVLRADYDPLEGDLRTPESWATTEHTIRGPAAPNLGDSDAYTYPTPPNVAIYPRLRGRGHQFVMTDFATLRDIRLDIEPT